VIKSRGMGLAGHVARVGGIRNAYIILVGKLEGKRPPERSKYRWEVTIRMDRQEIGWEGVNWMHLVQYRDQWRAIMNAAMNCRFTQKAGNC
jgi:hypothetical protein